MDKELDPRGYWEYGYVARFDNGEEYEWDVYRHLQEAEEAIARLEEEEEWEGWEDALTYTLRKRWVVRIEETWEELD